MVAWVVAADQSSSRIPRRRMQEAYDGGLRVLGGYGGGGSAGKQQPAAECRAWLDLADDTGIAALFEIQAGRAVDQPGMGGTDAKAARAAWRARGYPDACSIFVAVDVDVTMNQGRGPLAQYFRGWKSADTCLPVAYIENDVGQWLLGQGLIAGVFTPAAYGWNDPPVLFVPKNAPPGVVWTQEHNGRPLYGADLDMGHIRTDAPIWWADGRLPDWSVDTVTTAQDVWAEPLPNRVTSGTAAAKVFMDSINFGVDDLRKPGGKVDQVGGKVDSVGVDVDALKAQVDTLQAKVDTLPTAEEIAAAVVAALPPAAGGAGVSGAMLAAAELAGAEAAAGILDPQPGT